MAKKEEMDILKKVDGLFKEAASYRQKKEKEWHENERFYKGNQWRYSQERPVKNWCFTIVEGELPILTDSRPGPAIVPIEQEREDDAKILDSSIQYVLEQQDYQFKVNQAVRSALVSGPAWQFVDYDPRGDQEEGAITIRNIDWRFVWVDPVADDIEQADFAIVDEPIRVEELKRIFPKHADKIEKAKIESQSTDDSRQYVDPERWQPDFGNEEGADRYQADSVTSYRKTWLKDYSREKIPEEETQEAIQVELESLMNGESPFIEANMNHEQHIIALESLGQQVEQEQAQQMQEQQIVTEQLSQQQLMPEDAAQVEQMMAQAAEASQEAEIIKIMIIDAIETHKTYLEVNSNATRPKYPNNWRLVITCNKNSLLLFDGATDVDDGMIPLVPYYCYKSDDVYGVSEIQNIKDSQKSYNDMDWSEYKNLRLNGNSGWIKDQDSGVDDADLTNEEGIVITKNPGKEVRRLEPGAVSPQFQMRKQDDQVSMERISGVNEATQGRRPAGVTAASAIRFLQEQSVGRIRLKTRYLEEYSIPRLARLIASRIIEYWTSERKLRIYDGNGRIQHIDYSPEEMRTLKYEVKAVPGSTVGLDKESIFSLYTKFLEQGVITPKLFFQTVDIPYKNKILEGMEENDEMAMQMEQLMAENEQLKAELGVPQQNIEQTEV